MSVDLTDILERTSAPPMGIDPYAVVQGGRRRRFRRRVTGIATSVAVVAALGGGAVALADRPTSAPVTPVGSTSTTTPHDAVLNRPATLEFDQKDVDDAVRTYRVVVEGNPSLHRNEAYLYTVGGDGTTKLLSGVALPAVDGSGVDAPPTRGEGVPPGTTAGGPVWGVSPTGSGNAESLVTLEDGTQVSSPHRPIPGASLEVFVANGFSPSQLRQEMSVVDQ